MQPTLKVSRKVKRQDKKDEAIIQLRFWNRIE